MLSRSIGKKNSRPPESKSMTAVWTLIEDQQTFWRGLLNMLREASKPDSHSHALL